MLKRERVSRKKCPQCAWDAEGKPIDEARYPALGYNPHDGSSPPKCEYECGNCGYQWME